MKWTQLVSPFKLGGKKSLMIINYVLLTYAHAHMLFSHCRVVVLDVGLGRPLALPAVPLVAQ